MAVKSGNRTSTSIIRILTASLLAIAALVFLVLPVKAATATVLTLSITPTTVQQGSASQPPAVTTISITLTDGAVAMDSRNVTLYWRADGTGTWNTISTEVTDINGEFTAANFPPEPIVGLGPGVYEFQAGYTPEGPDITVYDPSTSPVVHVTITPHPIETTVTALTVTPSTVVHSSASQPPVMSNIAVSLTSGGIELVPPRGIELSYRLVGTIPWTFITTVGSSIGISTVPLESFVGGVSGSYEMKAEYIPIGGDNTDYSGSESIVPFTLSPHPIEGTITTLTLTPSTVVHSSASQPPVMSNIAVSLTVGGIDLSGRGVELYYRLAGTTPWTSITMVGSGSGIPGVPLESIVGGVSGSYEMKAEYIPMGGDTTDYSGSSTIVPFTLSPHPIEATVVTLSISPAAAEHSTSLLPPVMSNIAVSLTVGGIDLSGRGVELSYRLAGTTPWTSITMVGSGSGIPGVPLETLVGGVSGSYEMKAEYIPMGGDTTDYSGSSDIKPFSVLPSSTDVTIVPVSGHNAVVSHASSTGVTVNIADSSLADGFQFTVTTKYFGAVIPPGVLSLTAASYVYYDVQVLPTGGGTLGPDVMATVEITNSTFDSGSLLKYWNGSAWDTVTFVFVAPHTVRFTVPATSLSGTPFVVFFGPPLISVGGIVYPVSKIGVMVSWIGTWLAWILVLTGVIVAVSKLRKKIRPNSPKR